MFENITVIIVTYNSQNVIKNCLESIKKLNIKTIIVDNLSNDQTLNIVKKVYSKANIIKSFGNIGYGRANNIGLKKVKTKYALILNPDTIINKEALIKMLEAFKQDKNIAIVSPFAIDSKMYKKEGKQDVFLLGRNKPYQIIQDLIYVEWANGGCLLLDKDKIANKVGFFDENIFLYCEDDDLCRRTNKAGLKIVKPINAIIKHKESTGTEYNEKMKLKVRFHSVWSSLYHQGKIKGSFRARIKAIKHIKRCLKKVFKKNINKKENFAEIKGAFSYLIGLRSFKKNNLVSRG